VVQKTSVREKAVVDIIERKNELKYILLIIISVCFLATGGIFVKLSQFPPIATGFYRILFSIPMLFPFVFKTALTVSTKNKFLILIAGVFLAIDLILWNMSFHLTTVANGNLLANLVPFTIIPISYFVFKERIPKKFFFGLAITLTGIYILMSGKIEPNMDNFHGDLLAFLTSIFYALFLLTVYRARDEVGAMTLMLIVAFGSVVVLFLAMVVVEGIYIPKTIPELSPLLGLALVSQILGQGTMSLCLGKVEASLSSVLVLAQPVVAAIYSFFIFSEKLSIFEVLGIVITLVGIYYSKKSF